MVQNILPVSKKGSKQQLRVNEPPEQSPGQSNDAEDNKVRIREAILAFRTITTMLSMIQSPTEVTKTGQKDTSNAQRSQLRVLDALAAVIIREHGVAAVMAKSYDGDSIQVLTSVNNLEPALTISQQQQHSEGHTGWNLNLVRWFVTPNPRSATKNPKVGMDSMTTQRKLIAIVDPDKGICNELSTAQRHKLLDTYLQTEWWAF